MEDAMWLAAPEVYPAGDAGETGGSGDATAERPFTLAPLSAKGRPVGSLAAIGERPGGWDEASLRLIALVGRELGMAIENERLFRNAVEAAAVEALLSDISRLAGAGVTESAFREVLACVAGRIGARIAIAVTVRDGSPEVIARHAVPGNEPLEITCEALLPELVPLVAERYDSLLWGGDGDAPLPAQLVEVGAETAAIVPLRVSTVGAGPVDDARSRGGSALMGEQDPPLVTTVQTALLFVADSTDHLGHSSASLLARLATILQDPALTRLRELQPGLPPALLDALEAAARDRGESGEPRERPDDRAA
jgi:GAF domain-containing protein